MFKLNEICLSPFIYPFFLLFSSLINIKQQEIITIPIAKKLTLYFSSGSARQTPNTYPEPSPDRTKIDPCGACPPYPEPNLEHATIRIPSGHKKSLNL